MRSFINMREIVKICTRSLAVYIEAAFRYRTPQSDRLLVDPFRVCKQNVEQPELRRTQAEAFSTSCNSMTYRVEA